MNQENYIPKSDKNLIMFYLNNLSYARVNVVDKKSGLRNLVNEEEEKDKVNIENNKEEIQKGKKRKKNMHLSDDESSEKSEKYNNNILTKEKILELQVFNYSDIRNFIFSLPIYGSDVALERFRPNGDKYSASKITESLIKIKISEFCKRIDEKVHLDKNLKRKKIKNMNNSFNNPIESPKSSSTDNHLFPSTTSSSLPVTTHPVSNNQGEDLNKGLSSDSSTALANVFKSNAIKYIRILINLAFLATILLLLLEFLITYRHMKKLQNKINYLQKGYTILSNMLYTKHFVTEGVIATTLNESFYPVVFYGSQKNYLNIIANELALNRRTR